jgi:hypothetical protein
MFNLTGFFACARVFLKKSNTFQQVADTEGDG